jgi:hypothetical protein
MAEGKIQLVDFLRKPDFLGCHIHVLFAARMRRTEVRPI